VAKAKEALPAARRELLGRVTLAVGSYPHKLGVLQIVVRESSLGYQA
jgi:hypothetical protein